MAPSNGAAGRPGTGAGGAPRPAFKSVVPALPLTYAQRQAKTRPPAAVVAASGDTHTTLRDESGSAQAPLERRPRNQDARSHGTSPDGESWCATEAVDADALTPSAAPAKMAPVASELPPRSTSSKEVGCDAAVESASIPATYEPVASPTPTRQSIPPALFSSNGHPNEHHSVSVPPAPGTESTARRSQMTTTSQHRLHQTHPSNGSLVFGGFHGSNNSSPAPDHHGTYPPPNFMSYPPAAMRIPAVDNYGRPMLISPTMDGFPPAVIHNHHGPPTPHSFHGSQSSIHAEDGAFPPYPALNVPPGYPVHSAPQAVRHVPPMDPSMNTILPHAGGAAGQILGVSKMQFQTLNFIRGGIEHPEFSDCTLELRLLDNSASSAGQPGHQPSRGPLRVPCHRFILAQSPTLKHILQARGTSPDGTLVIELHDPYLRDEAFYFTLRTLYGWDFGDDYLPTYRGLHGVKDELELALGYVAAASYLQLPLVHAKAVHYTCRRLLHWETIEQACKFALPSAMFGHPARHDHSSTAEAYSLAELLDAIIAFIVTRLPPNFVLDTSVDDGEFSRLPPAGPASPSRDAPAIARGSSGAGSLLRSSSSSNPQSYMPPRGSRLSANPRLSKIQFGDLSPQPGKGAGSAGQVPAEPHSPTSWDTILSRILLNLPFSLLKQILEHPGLGKPSGDLDPQARQDLISSVVAEREARRLRTFERGFPQLKVFQDKLDAAAEPLTVQQLGDFLVNNMGFKEEVFPGDVPYLVQTWVNSGSGNVSA